MPDVLDLAADIVWGVLLEEDGVGELFMSVSAAMEQGLELQDVVSKKD